MYCHIVTFAAVMVISRGRMLDCVKRRTFCWVVYGRVPVDPVCGKS